MLELLLWINFPPENSSQEQLFIPRAILPEDISTLVNSSRREFIPTTIFLKTILPRTVFQFFRELFFPGHFLPEQLLPSGKNC
jgi:hypothetical protein